MRNEAAATQPIHEADSRFWRRCAFTSFLALQSSFSAQAQVANDDIERRQVLQLEQPVSSNTTDCTVQWSAVDEKLTGRCIEYHNDQWFEFTPRVSG
ncbi:MAG TPA: hypothetical protein VK364_11445, partial [Hymenobacter sp.]|nr:hypothetical protein [Hymenobacter sp.]